MKKFLIFYGSYGGGHLSAAKSIKQYLENNYKNIDILLVDCVEYINSFLNKLTTTAYTEMAKKAPWMWKRVYTKSQSGSLSKLSSTSNKIMAIKLKRLIVNYNPDYIISTHPFSSQMCSFLKRKNKIHCKLATIMTDYAIHNQWLDNNENSDCFFVAHNGMKEDMIKLGVPENKIYSTGIPLSLNFLKNFNKESIFNEFDLDSSKFTILFFAGGEFGIGRSKTYNILDILITNFSNIQVIAISGKNKKMESSFHELVIKRNKQKNVKILSYTNKVPELMHICNLVITKPGGLTTTESLACGLPILIINPIPGQEEENALFLEKSGAAFWLKKNDDIYNVLYNILNNKEKLEYMKNHSLSLSNKNSTKDICEIIMKSIG